MMNTMMYSNASRRDLDSWERLGNKGWNWDSLQPYYNKQETFVAPSEDIAAAMKSGYLDSSFHGTDGPIKTTISSSLSGWMEDVWLETAKVAGYPQPDEPRKGVSLGAFNQLLTIDPKTWTRSYSYTGYIEPHLDRPNLKILTNAKAGKILLSKGSDEAVATGVEFLVDDKHYIVNVSREVISSAGSIQTPQLLELSGIGDPAILGKHGIEVVVANKAVGTNLQDHPLTGITYAVKDDVPTAEAMVRSPEIGAQLMQAYTEHGAGPMTGGLTGIGFASLHMVSPDLTTEQVNQLVDKADTFKTTGTHKQLKIQEEQLRDPEEALIQYIVISAGVDFRKMDISQPEAFGHSFPGGYATLLSVSTHLFSRGTVHIGSNDPIAQPLIDPNYMSHPLDAEIVARSVMHARELMRTEPFASKFKRSADGDFIPIPSHNGTIDDPKTLEEAKEYVKANLFTCYHPIGTASMLPKEDGGVVDTELKVYGTKNLRVIDASVFPLHVQGNIMSLVYAVAERGADIIKAARR
jgi:choline dehydrogenase-like flavoprotein